ncbi:hypothetical protein R3W88_026760 [Solanum pinnatisectum]|uniref:DUF4283 domain-containing protein n=1 Tax=Solanum pinnatisectum TaxID=50273 RepID=A0AAV9LE63_9SOLN|nr:hypothetical protein R3W88_026760 [Solanum pinnatisectum]
MAEERMYTLVGLFLKPRPQIDRIRSRFKEMISIKVSAKIGVYDNYNVIKIDEMQMWLQKWYPDFKLEEDLPVALAWVLLPSLPFHLHYWHYV